jgi:hypothetical protein
MKSIPERFFALLTLHFRSIIILMALMFLLPASKTMAQAIQVSDAHAASAQEAIHRSAQLPEPSLSTLTTGEVSLRSGLFHERRELTKAYLLRLKTEDLLQNHYLEAGIRIEKPYEQMHQGWEAPYCQVRGHFAGHWLSSASHFAATDHDPLLATRASEMVQGLKRCQELNGGQWVGSIPEKYFSILADGKEPIWSPNTLCTKR